MTCDLCGKSEATVHLTEVINESTRELHLCEACAREKGAQAAEGFGLAGLLAGLTDFGTKLEEGQTKSKLKCPQCGMTYEDFRRSGKLGCGNCYETFHRALGPLLKRIHGSAQHVGKVPVVRAAPRRTKDQLGELQHLKERLRQAIGAEDFEEAARLRDRIRALEPKSKQKR